MVKYLGQVAQEKNLSPIEIPYYPTAKNQPVKDFLEKIAKKQSQPTEKGELFEFASEELVNLSFTAKEPEASRTQKSPNLVEKTSFVAPCELLREIGTKLRNPEEIWHDIAERQQNIRSEKIGEYVPPRNQLEEQLALIWQEVLKVDRVGIYDNFFELGGNSLLATQVISRIRESFQLEVSLKILFEAPTIYLLHDQLPDTQLTESNAIISIDRNQKLPLSFAQERLWFLDKFEEQSNAYHEGGAIRLIGNLNIKLLNQSFAEIIRRHEILRTNFSVTDAQAYQVIDTQKTLVVHEIDLSELSVEKQLEKTQEITIQKFQTPFNLKRDLLLRVTLIKLAENQHILLVVMHHIICDGWSFKVLIQELSTLYTAYQNNQPSPLPELTIQYADFAAWQKQELKAEKLEQQLNYWKQQLSEIPPLLELPTDHPRPAIQTFEGSKFNFTFSSELSQKLQELSQQMGVTLFMTLLSAFSILLCRYSRQEEIAIGSPIANRNRAEIEPLIGFFVNTLVMRINLENNPTVTELLQKVRRICLEGYAHQDVPFEKLVEETQPARNLSHSPLFQVMFALQKAPVEELKLPGLSLLPVDIDNGIAKFDLTLSMEETSSGLKGFWEYNTNLFEKETIERMFENFQVLLEGMVNNPDEKVAKLPLLTEGEKQQILVEWNETEAEYPKDKCIHQLFEEQVERTPNAIAVVYENQQLTYQELNEKANQLGHYLQKLGVKPDTLVGICVERSMEMVIGLLGILKAGGAYVPIDPNYPQERIEYMLEDSGIRILVTQESFRPLYSEFSTQLISLDTDQQKWERENQTNPIHQTHSHHLAYINYTSGSTGQPKGVMIPHRGVIRLLINSDYVELDEAKTFLHLSPIAFDASTFEIWGALLYGGKCIIFPEKIPTALTLKEAINQYQVTTLWLTAALFNLVIDELPEAFIRVKELLTGGEALSVHHVKKALQALPSTQLINGYGPTENTTFTCCYSIPSFLESKVSSILIGRPINNTQIYILDPNLQPVPVGVPGELHIGGDGLARGYLNRPDLTAEKFIPNPFGTGKLYKTGDLCRYRRDGNIEYIGRIDHQVKIRGFRIELGEIETQLSNHPEIRESVVIAREDAPGNKQLVAYLVSDEMSQSSVTQTLRDCLKEQLPDYMIPSAFVLLEKLPLTPNGKIDRRALPAPDSNRRGQENYIAPQTPTQELLANIWQTILKIEKISLKDNFFELGGHSLLATQIISRVRETFSLDLPIRALFETPP
ncbi:non-ribosomal peptide synthetase [Crocosphaera chwakensis]|nr:non-ribosomal peptide synthetase [Crocosphaera chwakensis]